jgi:transcription elongation factor GreA
MSKEILLTQEGFDGLQERLNYLQTQARPAVSEKIKLAREFGDLSENAEYDAAKDEQSQIEAEIKELTEKLDNAQIIKKEDIDTKLVCLGSTVKLAEEISGDKFEYKIVTSTEANIFEHKISDESPVGAAIMGKKKGTVVDVVTPAGINKIKIVNISI